MRANRRNVLCGLITATALMLTACGSPNGGADIQPDSSDATAQPITTIYLVRHAEKADSGEDPALTEAGRGRAEALADRLQPEGITAIWSTDYVRTRDTAAPLAARLGLDVQIYDARDLAGFAEQLRAMPGRILVVGHSNTTPELVDRLGGDYVSPIEERDEYDRLYTVRLNEDGSTTSTLERYGVRYVPPSE